jgi:hypothetical protein
MHAAPRPAMDDARRLLALKDLEELSTSVRLERLPRVVREPRGIARPRRLADFDHDPHDLVATGELPEPTARVPFRTRVPTEVRADRPSHDARLRDARHAFLSSVRCEISGLTRAALVLERMDPADVHRAQESSAQLRALPCVCERVACLSDAEVAASRPALPGARRPARRIPVRHRWALAALHLRARAERRPPRSRAP